MSQHYFATAYQGNPVTVVLGWDRPLQGYFCFVQRDDADCDEEEFVYSNLEDQALMPRMGFADSVDYFDALLIARGLTVPRAMVAEVEHDGRFNVGNRHVWYDQAGTVRQSR